MTTAALALALLLGCHDVAAEMPAQRGAPPTHEEVLAAVTKLRDDPNLGSEHSVRSLRWVDSKSPSPSPEPSPAWIVGLFEFLSQAASLIVWIAGGIAIAVTAVWLYRFLKAQSPHATARQVPRPSHIGELDIRPLSLPDDVGAAALALLEVGKTRDALSLLYRGALSRAVHRFGVTIDDSFTEGEALRAMDACLDRPRAEYIGELIGLWQRAVYAGQIAPTEPVTVLCTRFSATLGSAA